MTKLVYIVGKSDIPRRVELGAGESLDMTLIVLPGVSCSLPLRFDLIGEGAELQLRGLYLCNGLQSVDISVEVRHEAGGCTSRQQFRGIVGGEARASFFGKIFVRKDAQKTKAYQEDHNVLTSATAVAQTRPQLEIYADDVECSHGATVGSLNEDERFYMRSRGIPEAEAKVLQMISFVSPVMEAVEDEGLSSEIYEKLSEC